MALMPSMQIGQAVEVSTAHPVTFPGQNTPTDAVVDLLTPDFEARRYDDLRMTVVIIRGPNPQMLVIRDEED